MNRGRFPTLGRKLSRYPTGGRQAHQARHSISLVVVTASQYPDFVFLHLVDEAMLLIDSSGPAAGQFVLQRLGLAKPAKGSRCVSRINRIMRSACARSCSTHQARSSNPATSNSKLLNGCLERETGLPLGRLQEAILHRFTLQ